MNFIKQLSLFFLAIILLTKCSESAERTPAAASTPPSENPYAYNFPKSNFTDPRDNQEYATLQIENLEWFAENLNYPSKNSYCYNDDPSNCKLYGQLYTWFDAREVCPNGWRLPTRKDWSSIHKRFLRKSEVAYKALIEGGEAGFNGKLAGWRTDEGVFAGLDKKAAFWCADEIKLGYSRYYVLNKEEGKWLSNNSRNEYAFSCRCVRNVEK